MIDVPWLLISWYEMTGTIKILTSNEHKSIHATMCCTASFGLRSIVVAALRALRLESLSSAAWTWTP